MRSVNFFATCLLATTVAAQDAPLSSDTLSDGYEVVLDSDSLAATFTYSTGDVVLADGAATLHLPDSFKFLGGEQARQLVVDIWENPPEIADKLLGVISYADAGVFDARSAFIVYFDPIGHVSDADADNIDYGTMLKDMLGQDSLDNAQRTAQGYDALWLVGWASPPFYDQQHKALHWAKEMHQDGGEDNILNYNLRVLGRRGVLIINGVSSMSKLEEMRKEVKVMIDLVAFNDGYRYDQFDPDTDPVADRDIGGLIDGNVKEKFASVLKLLLKVAAIALASLIAIVALIVFLIRRKRSTPVH